jgi:hypothetical protein
MAAHASPFLQATSGAYRLHGGRGAGAGRCQTPAPSLRLPAHCGVGPIETYRDFIPDEALLKYDDAVRSGLFASFRVATPAYRAERQVDPWIVVQVRDADVYAGIAQWG